MRIRFGVLLVCLAVVGLPSIAAASPTYGVYGTIAEDVILAPTTNLAQHQQAQTGLLSTQQQTSVFFFLPALAVQVGPALLGPPPNQFLVTLSGSATVGGSIAPDAMGRPTMHGGASVAAPPVSYANGSVTTAGSSADASLYESWSDTMHAYGPANTLVQLQFTHHFDGVIFATGPNVDLLPNNHSAFSQLSVFGGSAVSCSTYCGGGNFNQTYTETGGVFDLADSFVISVLSGSDHTIEEQLILQALAGDQFAMGMAFVSAGDTDWTTIDVLTPGASVSFASGLNYASSTGPVPEPGTLALLGAAVASLAWRRRRQ